MEIRDKNVKKWVDVSEPECRYRKCYWPRPDLGIFTQGVGYRTRPGKQGWLCGEREVRGCPIPKPAPIMPTKGRKKDE